MEQISANFNPVILIMVKTPRPGQVKTRLRPVLTEAQCAALATCFLRDTVGKALKIVPRVIVAFSPSDGRNEIANLLPDNTVLVEQEGNNLGERMSAAFNFAGEQGFSPIITIGTDSPTLPPDYLKAALELFQKEETKIVLGKAQDGGYYLIGLRQAERGIFANVAWSSAEVFAQTAVNARRIYGCAPETLPVWHDVDTPQNLALLYRDFLENESFAATAPATALWFKQNNSTLRAKH